MTENETIKELDTSIDLAKMCVQTFDRKKEIEAYNTAIQALEEIQQYRAIGKVEEVKYLVDSYNGMIHDFGDDMSALEQYRAIGTIEEFKTLKEKSVAKKVVVEHIPKTSWTKEISHYLCPSCRSIFSFGGKPYCSKCGQKIDWE